MGRDDGSSAIRIATRLGGLDERGQRVDHWSVGVSAYARKRESTN